jgi:hypothetical protein
LSWVGVFVSQHHLNPVDDPFHSKLVAAEGRVVFSADSFGWDWVPRLIAPSSRAKAPASPVESAKMKNS